MLLFDWGLGFIGFERLLHLLGGCKSSTDWSYGWYTVGQVKLKQFRRRAVNPVWNYYSMCWWFGKCLHASFRPTNHESEPFLCRVNFKLQIDANPLGTTSICRCWFHSQSRFGPWKVRRTPLLPTHGLSSRQFPISSYGLRPHFPAFSPWTIALAIFCYGITSPFSDTSCLGGVNWQLSEVPAIFQQSQWVFWGQFPFFEQSHDSNGPMRTQRLVLEVHVAAQKWICKWDPLLPTMSS